MTPNIDDMFKPGDEVIAEWKPNPLLERDEYMRQLENPEPIPIDLNWQIWGVGRPDTRNTKVFVRVGDQLTIISKALSSNNHYSYLFKVRDKDGNEFYLSCEWFREALSTDLLDMVDSKGFVSLAEPI